MNIKCTQKLNVKQKDVYNIEQKCKISYIIMILMVLCVIMSHLHFRVFTATRPESLPLRSFMVAQYTLPN